MRLFSRIGLVPVALVCGPATAAQPSVDAPARADHAPAQPAAIEPSRLPLLDAGSGAPTSIADFRGRVLALHFLGGVSAGGAADFIRGVLGRADELAGVRRVFISEGSQTEALGLLEHLRSEGLEPTILLDEGVGLRAALVTGKDPAGSEARAATEWTVVLDADGVQLFWAAGPSENQEFGFDRFAALFRDATRSPSIEHYNLARRSRLAVEGYDVVAYHLLNRAVRGHERFSSEYQGVEYRFASAAHRSLFASDPDRYRPTYGGWCASAMGDGGRKVEVSPTTFKIEGGRLHLFYKDFLANALADWNRHPEWEAQADQHWKRIAGEPARISE